MRKIATLFLISLTISGNSQNRYSTTSTSTYSPMNSSEIMSVPMALKAKYDENQKYLYNLKKWIIELKTTIRINPFLGRLEGEYSLLTSMENDDLARATKSLNQREIEINEIISEYNLAISVSKQPKTQNSNTTRVENFIDEGQLFYQKKDYPNAILSFSKHLASYPDDTDVIFRRALAKSEMDDNYGAISDYERILEMEGKVTPKIYKFSTIYNNKAYCLVKQGMYKEAMQFVEKALQLDTSEWYIWDTRAEINLNIGHLDECISDCTKAISIHAHGNSYLTRGLAYIKKEEKAKGCQDLSKAGELGEATAYQKIKEYCNKK